MGGFHEKLVTFKGGPEPLEKLIHEILGSKREDRFSNTFFELVQNTCQVLLRYGNLCEGADTAKVPTEVPEDSRVLRARRLYTQTLIASTPGSSPGPPKRLGLDNSTSQPWSEAKCTCNTASSTLSCLFQQKERDKAEVSTSAGTFACPAETYRNCRGEAGTKNEPNWYFVRLQKNGSESRSSRSELKISLISCFKRFMSTLKCSKLPDF